MALVPNPTPTSTQSQRAVGAGNEGPTRRPSPAPAHNLKTGGPKSTPGPSSPSAADFDPQTPKKSLDPQESQVAKPDSWLEELHAPETSKIASESRISFETAKSRSPSTAGGPVRASSAPISTVLPYTSGDEKSVSFRLMRKLISFASVYFAFFL